ncbi:MAG: hypothetical protein ACK5JH_05415 [Anaerocolumna sp.]
MKITDFTITLNKEDILKSIDCLENNPIYHEVVEEYENMVRRAYEKIKPMAVLEFGEITEDIKTDEIPAGTKALYVITTVGPLLSEWSTKLFEEGKYLAGLLADGMGDNYLFQMEESIKDILIMECKKRNLGVYKRVWAPLHIPIEALKVAWEVTNANHDLSIKINKSYMFEPVKTLCNIFLLEEGCTEYKVDHDCRACNIVSCRKRKCQ